MNTDVQTRREHVEELFLHRRNVHGSSAVGTLDAGMTLPQLTQTLHTVENAHRHGISF